MNKSFNISRIIKILPSFLLLLLLTQSICCLVSAEVEVIMGSEKLGSAGEVESFASSSASSYERAPRIMREGKVEVVYGEEILPEKPKPLMPSESSIRATEGINTANITSMPNIEDPVIKREDDKITKMLLEELQREQVPSIEAHKTVTAKFTPIDISLIKSPFKKYFSVPQVEASIKELNYKGNYRVEGAREKLKYYEPLFKKIFIEEGVPTDLIALGFVESSYNTGALSGAGARGIWQFIPSTGKAFGLVYPEDYADPLKSTRAAARYLKYLHGQFDDWLLAIAAYNAGENRVRQAMKDAKGERDFWVLSFYLPSETQKYVPNVISAITILGNG